jgi:hypothetical protein
VGKSRLAIEAGHSYHERGYAALFIKSVDHTVFERDLGSLGRSLGVTENKNEVDHWLRNNENWLLILDGVNDRETQNMVIDFCDTQPNGHFLITSRIRMDWDLRFKVGEVSTLSMDSSRDLLESLLKGRRRLAGTNEKRDVDELIQALGGLPLAIEQAAGYLASTMMPIPRYTALLKSVSPQAVDYSGRLTDAKEPIARTWHATFNQLPGESRTMLRLLSYMTDDPIPSKLFDYEAVKKAFNDACVSDPFEPIAEWRHLRLQGRPNVYEARKRRASFPSYGRMTRFLPTRLRRMMEKMS